MALALAIVRLDAASSITEIIDKDVSLTTVVPSVRPPEKDRKFQSASIDKLISSLTPLFENADLGKLFENCLPNTLDTTVYSYTAGDEQTPPDSFIITGDIEALWLRDSTNQVLPYVPYIKDDPHLMSLVVGLINRQAQSLLINPFANSYNIGPTKEGHQVCVSNIFFFLIVISIFIPTCNQITKFNALQKNLLLLSNYHSLIH